MKYDNDFKIGFIRCKCGKSMVVKRKSFLGFKYFKGKCKHCNTKVRIRKIKKENRKQIEIDKKNYIKNSILKMKAEGMLNKEIANMLGIHRTTVTDYLKRYAPEYLKK